MTDADDRSSMEIETDIERTRAEMDDTIDALKRKFSPEELVDQAADYMRNHTGDIMMNFGQTLKENPVPLALVGLGIGWLLLSGKSTGTRSGGAATGEESYEGYYESYSEPRTSSASSKATKKASAAFEGISDKVAETVDEISARTSAAMDSISERASSTMDEISGRASSAYDATKASAQQHPLLLGALGLAVGIGVAMLLPRTRQEDSSIGEARDRMVEQVKEAGKETLQKAKDVASDAWEAAKQTVADEVMPEKDGRSGATGKRPASQRGASAADQEPAKAKAAEKTGGSGGSSYESGKTTPPS